MRLEGKVLVEYWHIQFIDIKLKCVDVINNNKLIKKILEKN